jgi:hypothetical protein
LPKIAIWVPCFSHGTKQNLKDISITQNPNSRIYSTKIMHNLAKGRRRPTTKKTLKTIEQKFSQHLVVPNIAG